MALHSLSHSHIRSSKDFGHRYVFLRIDGHGLENAWNQVRRIHNPLPRLQFNSASPQNDDGEGVDAVRKDTAPSQACPGKMTPSIRLTELLVDFHILFQLLVSAPLALFAVV